MRQNQSLAVNGVVLSVTAKRTLNSIIVSLGVIANWQTKTVFSWLYVRSVTELCTIEDYSKENSRQRHKEPTWKTTNAQERNFERDMEGVLTKDIYFVVDGEVRPKERPRFTSSGRIFTPKKTQDYERKVKACYMSEYPYGVAFPECPIEMVLNIYVEVPKSYSKKKRDHMICFEYPTKRPDADNQLKAIADALNGVAYTDDKQIVSVTLNKFWSEESKAEITIRELRK